MFQPRRVNALNLPAEGPLRLASARAVVVAGPVPRDAILALRGALGASAALVVTGEHGDLARELSGEGMGHLGIEPLPGASGLEALALKAPWTVDRLLVAGAAASSPAIKDLVRPGGLVARYRGAVPVVEELAADCG